MLASFFWNAERQKTPLETTDFGFLKFIQLYNLFKNLSYMHFNAFFFCTLEAFAFLFWGLNHRTKSKKATQLIHFADRPNEKGENHTGKRIDRYSRAKTAILTDVQSQTYTTRKERRTQCLLKLLAHRAFHLPSPPHAFYLFSRTIQQSHWICHSMNKFQKFS